MTLRDFNNAPFPDDPRALHKDPLGNSAGLESFHTSQPEDRAPNSTPKIVGALAVALMIGVAGAALYANSASHPKPVMTASNPPAPVSQPAPMPEPAADASMPATPPAAAADNAPAPAQPVKAASEPKKMHRTARIESSTHGAVPGSAAANRMAADSNQSAVQPQQQQAITAPSPSPSDIAANSTQSGVAVSPNATSASDIPAPAPQQPAPAAPAPAQPSGADQSAGQVNQ